MERDVQRGAIRLRVVLLLLDPPDGLPAVGSLGSDRRRAPAAVAAHADTSIFLHRDVGPARRLLYASSAAPKGSGLPAAGLQADLDLSEAGLVYGGRAQQAGAAHPDPRKQ